MLNSITSGPNTFRSQGSLFTRTQISDQQNSPLARFFQQTPQGQMTYDSYALSNVIKRTKDIEVGKLLTKIKNFIGPTGKLVLKKGNNDMYIALRNIDKSGAENLEVRGNCSIIAGFLDILTTHKTTTLPNKAYVHQ